MRRALVLVLAVGLLLVALAPAALGHTAPPCNDSDGDGAPSGLEYAKHHIVPLAHAGVLGQGHKPGTHHGFSVCLG